MDLNSLYVKHNFGENHVICDFPCPSQYRPERIGWKKKILLKGQQLVIEMIKIVNIQMLRTKYDVLSKFYFVLFRNMNIIARYFSLFSIVGLQCEI